MTAKKKKPAKKKVAKKKVAAKKPAAKKKPTKAKASRRENSRRVVDAPGWTRTPMEEIERLQAALARSEAKNLYLEQQMMMQLAKLELLQEVTRSTSSTFSLGDTLEMLMDVVLRTTSTDSGSLLLVDEAKDELKFVVARGPKANDLMNYTVPIGEGIAGWVAEHGQSVLTHDASRDHRFSERIAKDIKYAPKSIMCVPLKGRRKVLGVIELIQASDDERFNTDQLGTLEELAAQMSMVIENVHLFRENAEEIHKLEALTEASQVINSTLDLKKLLKLVMELAANTLNAEASSIFRIDEKSNDLYFDVVSGDGGEVLKQIRVPMGQGIVGACAESGKPLLVADVTKDPRFFKKVDKKSGFQTRSIVAVPLMVRGGLIGVVQVLNKNGGGEFNQEDVELLTALANQSAVAIDNAKLYLSLQDSFVATVQALAAAIDAKDSYTAGHSSRVTEYSVLIAEEMGLPDPDIKRCRLSGLLHDIGKIGIGDSVLSKPSALTDEEFGIMKKHPTIGANIILPIPQLADMVEGVRHHHERFDGRGYPDGLAGDKIPLMGRIIGVADAFDAMTSDRVYRPRLSDEIALGELEKHSGAQFDPEAVEAFMRVYGRGSIVTEPSRFKQGEN